MTRVFKHKNGWQANQREDGNYILRNPQGVIVGSIYSSLIEGENLTDWEEVTEPYVFTEDVGEIYDKDQKVFKATPSRKGLQIESYYANEDKEAILSDTKFFRVKENAEAYIERHKPRYSKDDLDHLRKKVLNAFNSVSDQNQIENEVLKAINIMQDSKND
jgi:hypothetical protein